MGKCEQKMVNNQSVLACTVCVCVCLFGLLLSLFADPLCDTLYVYWSICRTMRAVIAWHNESTEASKINISSKFFPKLSMKIDTSNPYSVCVSVYSFTLSVYGTLPQRHVHCFAVSIYFPAHTHTHTNFTHSTKNELKKKKCNILYFFISFFWGGNTTWANVAYVCAWYVKDKLKCTMSVKKWESMKANCCFSNNDGE